MVPRVIVFEHTAVIDSPSLAHARWASSADARDSYTGHYQNAAKNTDKMQERTMSAWSSIVGEVQQWPSSNQSFSSLSKTVFGCTNNGLAEASLDPAEFAFSVWNISCSWRVHSSVGFRWLSLLHFGNPIRAAGRVLKVDPLPCQ